jgi:hypothetical protein
MCETVRPLRHSEWGFYELDPGTVYCSLSRRKVIGDPLLWGKLRDEATESYRSHLAVARDLAARLQRHLETSIRNDTQS